MDLIEDLLRKTELPPRTLNPTHCNRNTALFEQACSITHTGITIDVTAFPKSDNKDEYSAAEAFKIYREKNLDNSKFTVSSDGGGCIPHFDKQGELLHLDYGRCELLSATLKELLDDGIPENEVLPAFTSNVATLLKLHQKGTIAVGNDADLVILDENNTVDSVMALGQWHQKNKHTIKRGSFEKLENRG